jgi:dihydrofolate synthase/folylpolyglutamate synthase
MNSDTERYEQRLAPRFSTVEQWLGWQESLHIKEIELGLERVRRVAERLALTSAKCPVISVAGTNGKGSSIAMLVSILNAAGYRVGAYTSPHLRRYNERIQIDQRPVSDQRLCAAFDRVERARGDTSLTYFEFGTLAALDVFSDAALDICILEVGLGGRLDAVNLVDADVALITTIAIDHVAWLGADRESIGREKAGIFRRGRPAVYAEADPASSVIEAARQLQTQLKLHGRDFQFAIGGKVNERNDERVWDWSSTCSDSTVLSFEGLPRPSLNGDCQIGNAAGVLAVLDTIRERFPVSEQAVRVGLTDASLSGRFEIIPGSVEYVLDVAHNAQAAETLARQLESLAPAVNTYAVVGMLMDKDALAVLSPLSGMVNAWYVGGLKSTRGAAPNQLAEVVKRVSPDAEVSALADIVAAFDAAVLRAVAGDRVVVFGSFLSVAAVLAQRLADTSAQKPTQKPTLACDQRLAQSRTSAAVGDTEQDLSWTNN